MTSKLRCPFCGEELKQTSLYMDGNSRFAHKYVGALEGGKDRCPLDGETLHYRGWQALIRTKKQLEIARKALEEIDTTRCIPQQTLISLGKFSKTTRFNAGNIICVATPDQIHNTLEQINRKED